MLANKMYINGIGQAVLKLLRQVFYSMFEQEIQIWPKFLVKKVTMQCTKMKTHTEACFPSKLTKTNHFPPILVSLIDETDSFWL